LLILTTVVIASEPFFGALTLLVQRQQEGHPAWKTFCFDNPWKFAFGVLSTGLTWSNLWKYRPIKHTLEMNVVIRSYDKNNNTAIYCH